MKLHLGRCTLMLALFVGAFVFAVPAYSQEEDNSGLVRVEMPQDVQSDYKYRREDHGFLLGFSYEPLKFTKYISTIGNSAYEDAYGDSAIPLLSISLDYKYNFILGGVTFGLGFGMGTVKSNHSGEDRTLDLTKYSVGVKYIADNIFTEPYVAPYIGFSSYKMEIAEKSPTDKFAGSTEMALCYTFGLQIQLDWLDSDSDSGTNFAWGLENTFLDVFVTQYMTAKEAPDTSTDFILGGGLKLEF